MISNPYQQYQATQTQTADGGQLVVMLYEGAIKFLNKALIAMEQDDRENAHNYLMRTQNILEELMSTLDFEAGGEIATNLFRIYEYMHHRLVEANIKKSTEPIREVSKLLRELLPAWQEAARRSRCEQKTASAVARTVVAVA